MTPTQTRRMLAAAGAAMMIAATPALAADKIEVLTTDVTVPVADLPEGSVEVTIEKMKYQTPEVTIKAGAAVTWHNLDVMPHNAAFNAGAVSEGKMDGMMLKKDQTYTVKFLEPGTYDYHCTPHPFMRGKVIVE